MYICIYLNQGEILSFLLYLTYRKTIDGNHMNKRVKDTLKDKYFIQKETLI